MTSQSCHKSINGSIFFNWEKDLVLFFVYMIPSNLSRNDINIEEDCFDRLFNKLASADNDSMKLVCGDLKE